LKPHNIGTHLKGIATSFQVVPLFLKASTFGRVIIMSLFEIFSKYLQACLKGTALLFAPLIAVTFS
jgi:hypothetical protein